MDYSIYKDDSVQSTVEKILRIFESVGINIGEVIINAPSDKNYIAGYTIYPKARNFLPCSSRIKLFNMEDVGTNGKGTTKENCRASAFAELMERIQNQHLQHELFLLSSDKFSFAPDEREYDESTKEFISKYKYDEILSICQPEKFNTIEFKKVSIPYFNIKDNKVHYLPPLRFIFSSNGMAAGNTPEEALVQAFSEICERYAHEQVFENMMAMPEIPKKYYEKYERLKDLIDYTEQLGWEVCVKDASLGAGLPVVCTTFENKSKGIFTYKFGSQPSLPIAIERTITEVFQGGVMRDCDIENRIYHINNYSKKELKHLFFDINRTKWFFKNSDKIHKTFFNKNADYKFSASSWVNENKKYTNKELLKFLVDKITKITDNDIFIRDVSFLGFPSYHVFIPKFSDDICYDKEKLNMHKWILYPKNKKNPPNDIESLISAILFSLKYKQMYGNISMYVPDEYILILYYIVKNDIKNIIKYCRILQKQKVFKFNPEFAPNLPELIDIIYQFFMLKQKNEHKNVINNILNNLYSQNEIKNFYDLLDKLDFEYIKNLVLTPKEIEHQKFLNRTIKQEDMDLKNRIENVKQKLIQKYIDNTPDQTKLAEVFNFANVNN